MPCMIITLMSIVYLSFHHLLSPLKVLGNSGDQQDWSQGLWGDFHTKGKMGSYIFKTSDHSFTSFMDHLALLFFSAKKKNQKHRFLGLESLLLFWMDYWLCWWWEKYDLCVGSTEERWREVIWIELRLHTHTHTHTPRTWNSQISMCIRITWMLI